MKCQWRLEAIGAMEFQRRNPAVENENDVVHQYGSSPVRMRVVQ
jgi:hypothetical protein